MSEIDLPIFTGLATMELVEGLAEMESAMGVCLTANRAGLLDPMDGGLEAPWVKQEFQEGEKALAGETQYPLEARKLRRLAVPVSESCWKGEHRRRSSTYCRSVLGF
jgi:hypothetical protein